RSRLRRATVRGPAIAVQCVCNRSRKKNQDYILYNLYLLQTVSWREHIAVVQLDLQDSAAIW
ncbi:hypothetical protein V5799_019041, partial [Amblyomma americanum]